MKINGKEYRTVAYDGTAVSLIDQNELPFSFKINTYTDYRLLTEAIKDMTVRGAPAIGATAAYAMALAAKEAKEESFRAELKTALNLISQSRPTAIDLTIGAQYVYEEALKFIPNYNRAKEVALMAAEEFAEKSVQECYDLGAYGAELIPDGARILTHCNAGALATVDHGTALAVIRAAKRQGKDIFVYVDETRPRLQGARLTAFELKEEGIDHAIITDAAAGYYFWKNEIDIVITGADRICLNGDIANKIGTYEKAVLAKEHKVPFYIAAPKSSFDFSCFKGSDIPIEFRAEEEVLEISGVRVASPGSSALNPAFDVTEAKYITGIITPKGVFAPSEAAREVQS